MSTCRCGHDDRDHGPNGGQCYGLQPPEGSGGLTVQPACPCQDFDDGVLPAAGERPVFGVHRLPSAEVAWTTEPDSVRERKFREWVKGAPGDMA